jgi:DNA polymerase IV
MDAFFASVEQHDHPEWRGLPVVVGAKPSERGVVAASSYEARKFGIRSAMPSRDAGRLCPHAIFVRPNMRRYAEVSRQIHAIFERFTPLVEPVSVDEAFLDVTGTRTLYGPGPAIARLIKQAIRLETGLTASVGVATNKYLARIASDMNKPDGLTIVPESPTAIRAFLAPLPVSRVWGVGKVTQATLERASIRTIGDLQQTPEDRLACLVGRGGAAHLLALSIGEDTRDVETEYEEQSISREVTFPVDCTSAETLRSTLVDLADDVGQRLRDAGKYAGLARLKLRWQGFKTITRQRPFEQAVCDDFSLREAAEALFHAEKLVKPVRLIGFGVLRLADRPDAQLELFGSERSARARKERLSRTVDQIRKRLGQGSIRRAGADGQTPDG